MREGINLATVKRLYAAGWALLLAGVCMNLVTALLQEDLGYYTVIGNFPALLQVVALLTTAWAIGLHAASL